MTASLRASLKAAPRAEEDPAPAVMIAPSGRLERGEALALGPAAAVPAGAEILISIAEPLALTRVLIALDGHAGGLLLVSSAIAAETAAQLAETAGCTLTVSDRSDLPGALRPDQAVQPQSAPDTAPEHARATRWMMTTSGTTGIPKIVPHSLASLSRTVRRDPRARAPVWGLVLEMTRFAGLQVSLQALLGGGSLVVAPQGVPMADQIAFLAAQGVSHLSATPTLWRRLLMAPGLDQLALRQVTLGGEIADQAVLDALAARFPEARITHIYASTEAGVGFAVNDRKAGFPMAFTETPPGGIGLRIADGQLWLRPPDGRQVRYLGGQTLQIDGDGHIATGDRIEIRGDRALFLGRDSGVVNVGGVKVYPERVERTIAGVAGVGLAQVTAKSNPITGALLMATVVPADSDADQAALRDAILTRCRDTLEREAVPARIRFAEALQTNAAGKITRA